MRFDPNEVVLFSLFEERNSLAHDSVGDDDPRLRLGVRNRRVECCHDGVQVIAVDSAYEPAEGSSLSTNGSNPIICFEGPSACWLLTSMIAIKLSSLWCAADIIASHFEPSSSSPSENSVKTRLLEPLRFNPRPMPTAMLSPSPRDPPDISMPGV